MVLNLYERPSYNHGLFRMPCTWFLKPCAKPNLVYILEKDSANFNCLFDICEDGSLAFEYPKANHWYGTEQSRFPRVQNKFDPKIGARKARSRPRRGLQEGFDYRSPGSISSVCSS